MFEGVEFVLIVVNGGVMKEKDGSFFVVVDLLFFKFWYLLVICVGKNDKEEVYGVYVFGYLL